MATADGKPSLTTLGRDSEIDRCHCGAWRPWNQADCFACQRIQARYVAGLEPRR